MEDDGEVVERTFPENVELYRVDGRFLFFRPDIDRWNRRRETGKMFTPGYTVEDHRGGRGRIPILDETVVGRGGIRSANREGDLFQGQTRRKNLYRYGEQTPYGSGVSGDHKE